MVMKMFPWVTVGPELSQSCNMSRMYIYTAARLRVRAAKHSMLARVAPHGNTVFTLTKRRASPDALLAQGLNGGGECARYVGLLEPPPNQAHDPRILHIRRKHSLRKCCIVCFAYNHQTVCDIDPKILAGSSLRLIPILFTITSFLYRCSTNRKCITLNP